jgi:flagellar hook-associated protein 1 FlgK
MAITSILNIAKGALSAQQSAIQTISHNIANVNTPGYSREEAILEEAQPVPSAIGLMGDGVVVQGIKSYLDQNLQNAITRKNSDVQEQQVYEKYLTQIQSIFDESNSNLSSNITTFFNDWSTLSTDPTSTSDKQTLASDGKTLCTTFNTLYSDLVNLQSDLNGEVNSQIDDINGLTSKIASLNQLMSRTGNGTSEASDYVDQRNQLLQQLGGYTNISYFTDSSNMVSVVTSKGLSLVDGTFSYQLKGSQDATTGMTDVSWQGPSGASQDVTSQISSGSLGAVLATRDTTIPLYLGNLNGLAQSIMQNVNYFHEQGNDNAGIPFFQCDTPNYARGISLANQIAGSSGTVQTQNIMASSSTAHTTGNDVALRIASLANDTLLGGGTIVSTAASSETTPLGLSGRLAVNGVPVAIGVGDSLSDMGAAINAVRSQTGVTASVVQSSSGYQLVLETTSGGGNFSVVNGDLDTSSQGLLQTLTSTPVFSTGVALGLTGTIRLGQGTSVSVSATDSLTAIEGNVNNNTGTTGVSASISTDASGNSVLVLSKGGQPISIPGGTITGTVGLAGSTYAHYEAGVAADIGQATKSATDLADYNKNALTSLQQKQSEESGVSIDEEMSNLIMYQNAYQASARLYTVAQAMLNSLLNSVGVTTQ